MKEHNKDFIKGAAGLIGLALALSALVVLARACGPVPKAAAMEETAGRPAVAPAAKLGNYADGLRMLRDPETGCEYLYRAFGEGALTPRMEIAGIAGGRIHRCVR